LAPDSIGTPSKPICAFVVVAEAVPDVEAELDELDELEELLLPQPASSAATASVDRMEMAPRRIRI
jgi:hypothetical protein